MNKIISKGSNVTASEEPASSSDGTTGTKRNTRAKGSNIRTLPASLDKLERLRLRHLCRAFGEPIKPSEVTRRILDGTLPPIDGLNGTRRYWLNSSVIRFLKQQA